MSFLGVGIAYPGSRSRPRPSSNHTGSAKGAGVKHGGEVLVLLAVIEWPIPYLIWIYRQARQGRWFLPLLLRFHAAYGVHATKDKRCCRVTIDTLPLIIFGLKVWNTIWHFKFYVSIGPITYSIRCQQATSWIPRSVRIFHWTMLKLLSLLSRRQCDVTLTSWQSQALSITTPQESIRPRQAILIGDRKSLDGFDYQWNVDFCIEYDSTTQCPIFSLQLYPNNYWLIVVSYMCASSPTLWFSR